MKLSSKLNRGMIILLVLIILASLFTSLYVLKSSFGTFIQIERDKSFEQISSDLKRFAQSESGLNPLILENYAQNEKLLNQYESAIRYLKINYTADIFTYD